MKNIYEKVLMGLTGVVLVGGIAIVGLVDRDNSKANEQQTQIVSENKTEQPKSKVYQPKSNIVVREYNAEEWRERQNQDNGNKISEEPEVTTEVTQPVIEESQEEVIQPEVETYVAEETTPVVEEAIPITEDYDYNSPSQVEEPVENIEQTVPSNNTNNINVEYDNALVSAREYLAYVGGFSRQGLIEQLQYEGYSYEACVYAVDNCGADWNEQCAISARDYMELVGGFSRQELHDQLAYEGFTEEQIQYGLSAVGY